VKCGSGAFMKNAADAERLAGIMADMGRHVGRRVTVVISSMAQPLGMYIGNSLEVMEAIEVLKGNVGGDLLEVSLTLGANMLLLAECRVRRRARHFCSKISEMARGLQNLRSC